MVILLDNYRRNYGLSEALGPEGIGGKSSSRCSKSSPKETSDILVAPRKESSALVNAIQLASESSW